MSYTEQDRIDAAEWFVDIHDVEDPSPELLQDWMRWLEASEAHRHAFTAVEQAWRSASAVLRTLPPASADDGYDGSTSVQAWRTQRATKGRAGGGIARQSLRLARLRDVLDSASRRPLGLALAAAAGLCAVFLVVPQLHPMHATTLNSFATGTGEQMQVILPDGSQVNLGARSKLAVDYTRAARNVRLEAGEAFFSVQKDVARPFRVHVLDGIVTAVGTAFDVRTTNDRVLVAVSEGTVQVNGIPPASATAPASTAMPDARAPALARLRRGEVIDFIDRRQDHTLVAEIVRHVDPAEPARWRDGWLVYRDEPLRDVLADIARYTDQDIIVALSLSANPHFTGAVYKDNILEWLESLPNAFPVTVTVDGARITVAPVSQAVATREIP